MKRFFLLLKAPDKMLLARHVDADNTSRATRRRNIVSGILLNVLTLAAIGMTCILVLNACTPAYNWRTAQGTDAPYTVLLPAKPSSFSRPVNLDGMTVTMTMTAAEVNGVTFAVGTAELANTAQAQHALRAMKIALVRNIGGAIRQEKVFDSTVGVAGIEIEAYGTSDLSKSAPPKVLFARFFTQDRRIYQMVVLGKETTLTHEAIDTFFTSFKLLHS